MKDKTKEELKQIIVDTINKHMGECLSVGINEILRKLSEYDEAREALKKEKQYSKNLEEMILSLNNELNKYKAICKERAYNEEP